MPEILTALDAELVGEALDRPGAQAGHLRGGDAEDRGQILVGHSSPQRVVEDLPDSVKPSGPFVSPAAW